MSANRSEFLKNCVARLFASHMDYVQSREDAIGPKHAFWLAAEALLKAVDDPYGDIPGDCRQIFVAIWGDGENTGFKAAWNNWARRELVNARPSWKPNAAVWRAFHDLKRAMKADIAAPMRLVDSVAELVRQGVDDSQIAVIYEKFTRTGARDTDWVRKMKEHPELNTEETRMLGKRKKEMSRQEWESFAERLASNPRIQQVRQMLEAGDDMDEAKPSRFGEEFELREFEPRPFEELPSEWDQPQQYEPHYEAHAPQGGINVEQRALMLLDEGTDDGEITRQLGISGQKLGAIKRNADRIRESMRELAEV